MADLLLKNANVIFVDDYKIKLSDILIKNGRIEEISSHITSDYAKIIDCSNQWIIPGLIDMHVHIRESFAPLFTAAGVTTVRNTSGSILELEEMMNADIAAKTPRVITSDRLIDGPPGLWGPTSPYSVNIDDVESAKREVSRQVELGAELIKVYGLLDATILKVVCDEAKKYHKEVSADLVHSSNINGLEAAEIGVKWFEHASGLLQVIHPDWSMKAESDVWEKIDWLNFDNCKIRDMCRKLLKYDANLCPTMTLYDQGYLNDKPWKPSDSIITKLEENKGLINQWKFLMQSGNIKNKIGIQNTFIKTVSKVYHDMGGTVVCGTDTPAGVNVYPGLALHRELELFVESGFTEFEALRASTIVSADAMERDDIGRIVKGAVADMIILKGNPIEEISNSRNIECIIKGGKLYRPDEIIDSVPTNDENQKNIARLIDKFKDHGFSVDQFLA